MCEFRRLKCVYIEVRNKLGNDLFAAFAFYKPNIGALSFFYPKFWRPAAVAAKAQIYFGFFPTSSGP
jgi:hypothetical protein